MRRFKELICLIAVVLLLLLVTPTAVLAAPTATVTVNVTAGFMSLTVAPATWDVNAITGSGIVAVNTTYYANPLGDTTAPANPVVDAGCRFTITNTSTIATNVTVTWADFAGGDAMTNSNTGGNGALTFGAYSWNTGDAYPAARVIAKTAGSDYMQSNLAALTNLKFGLEINTRTNAWTSGALQQATVTVTLTQYN